MSAPQKCAEIPDRPILEFLLKHDGRWSTWFDLPERHVNPDDHMPSVVDAMPPGTPERLVRAKMARLIRRGLVGGCPCGCRGDYEITAKGKALLRGAA